MIEKNIVVFFASQQKNAGMNQLNLVVSDCVLSPLDRTSQAEQVHIIIIF